MSMVSVRVESIVVGERHRALSEDAVQRLAASMKAIGLRTPITVRVVDDYVLPDGEVCDGVPLLVTGRHRLAAARALGWDHIDCIDADDDEITAELWEIAENLHRLDLTKEQRDEHIRRYADLLEEKRSLTVQGEHPVLADGRRGGAQHVKSVSRQIAEETGISLTTVKRARGIIASPPPKPVEDEREARRNRAMTAWDRLDDEDRQWFRDWIDTPIMDVRHAA